jgi:hypothetical protein
MFLRMSRCSCGICLWLILTYGAKLLASPSLPGLPDGVTVAQQTLDLFVMVRIHVRQPNSTAHPQWRDLRPSIGILPSIGFSFKRQQRTPVRVPS